MGFVFFLSPFPESKRLSVNMMRRYLVMYLIICTTVLAATAQACAMHCAVNGQISSQVSGTEPPLAKADQSPQTQDDSACSLQAFCDFSQCTYCLTDTPPQWHTLLAAHTFSERLPLGTRPPDTPTPPPKTV
ncbi:MAG: hypothetical protein RLZZ502_1033 [Pseudomonadota bacterium]